MAQTGTLEVQVYTSRAQIPVEGAAVVVTRHGTSGKQEVAAIQVTDRSGNVRLLTLPAPPAEDSTSPNGAQPSFYTVNIWVEHPGYELMVMEDVQIFPGVETVQAVELQPLVRGEEWTQRPAVRPIPPQDL